MSKNIIINLIILIIACLPSSQLLAANYPLEIVLPKAAGSGSPAIPTTHRIFRAYPGIEYNINAAVIGGTYPITYSLSNAPAGMTINSSTGEISWPNPQSNAGPITLTVTDGEGTIRTSTWSITVSTSGFYFVDSKVGTNGNGTISSPFNSLVNARTGTLSHETDILYFRSGTYTIVPGGDGNDTASMFWGSNSGTPRSASSWIAYPGESVTVSGNHSGHVSFLRNYYIDKINFTHLYKWAINTYNNTSLSYTVVRRCIFTDLVWSTYSNENQGFIYTAWNRGYPGTYFIIQDNDFSGFTSANAIGSLYGLTKLLIERNYVHDGGGDYPSGFTLATPIGIKDEINYGYIRGNRVIIPYGTKATEVYDHYDGGNIDVSFNIFAHTTTTVRPVAFSYWFTPNMHVYRNTFVGAVVDKSPSSNTPPSGPYNFYNNIVITPNTNSTNPIFTTVNYFSYESLSRTTENNNYKSANSAGIIDADYKLINRSYVGTYGWETGQADSSGSPTVTSAQVCDDNGMNCRPIIIP